MSLVEIDASPHKETKEYILDYIEAIATGFVGKKRLDEIEVLADEIMRTGIKKKDATHLACSIIAGCDYFITTDKRVLKYKTDRIKVLNPISFLEIWGETE